MVGSSLDEFERLCIPIYLDQQVVFDLFAIMEDGIPKLSLVKTSESTIEKEKREFGGRLKAYVISLSGVKSKKEEIQKTSESLEEKVHTPTSLFSKLRSQLLERNLVSKVDGEITNLKPGSFIEFQAILKKNPLVDFLELVKDILAISVDLEKTSRKKTSSKEKYKGLELVKVLNKLLNTLKQPGSVELLADISGSETKALISAKLDNFRDQTLSDVVDGEYTVFGKVSRVVKSGESINLLRKTPFILFKQEILNELISIFSDAEEYGLKEPDIKLEIEGPVIHVIPIAIFT